jgi:hypothetical protein
MAENQNLIQNIKTQGGEEPTKAALKKAHVSHNSGQNEWYTPAALAKVCDEGQDDE